MIGRVRILLASLAVLSAAQATAHEVRPAYLQIEETAPGRVEIIWKQPVAGDRAIRLVPHLSNGWLEAPPTEEFLTPTYRIRTWRLAEARPGATVGQTVAVEGLERSITSAVVHASLADGRTFDTALKPAAPAARLDFGHIGGLAVPAYFRLGVEHILTGLDHLLFVLGLLLLVGVRWRLLKAITAFTAAHSLTLGASAFGLVHAPSVVIEALVALSIVFVAAELADPERRLHGLTARRPWLVAFAFGLLHGFAFAGALAEVGLPERSIPAALLLFNLGVEAGQLIFVGAAILAILALRPVRAHLTRPADAVAQQIPAYATGAFAAFWFIQRAASAFA
jgi:hydrogenase/urease accessory protein HupE